MEILINKKQYTIPFDLGNITISQFLEYHEKYGRDLDKELEAIAAKDYKKLFEDEDDQILNRELDLQNHIDREALAWVSFWTGIDLMDLGQEKSIAPLLNEYRIMRYQMKEQEERLETLPLQIEWEGEGWKIQDFVVDPGSGMTFNEIITSKEVIRQLNSLGKGRWDALLYLCCIFFRKKDEQFKDEFIQENSERMKLLQHLPLSHGLAVAFFLTVCVRTWETTLVSLPPLDQETPSLN
ncbi:MAG: hypothetical protein ACTHMM_16685 [Agriterribacter sp.]